MPFNVTTVVGFVGIIIGIAVWFRTRRVGPVVGVLLAAFVVVAIADPTILSSGGALVGRAFNWASNTLLNL